MHKFHPVYYYGERFEQVVFTPTTTYCSQERRSYWTIRGQNARLLKALGNPNKTQLYMATKFGSKRRKECLPREGGGLI